MRRARTATESLLSIALILEVLVVFFATLAAFALRALEPGLALGGGAAFLLLLLVTAGLVRWEAARWFGWLLQLALVATGLLVPLMYLIGAGFLALYAYCHLKGRSLDRARSEMEKTA